MYRLAYVYVCDEFAGILRETEDGYSLKYDDDYLDNPTSKDISLTLPKQKEEYQSKVLFPFFDGLIPEGWLLNVVINNWKLNPKDRFGIMLTACKDCIGNVSIQEEKL